MLDLSTIDPATLLARGQYATVRSAHEDEKKALQRLCGEMISACALILRQMQPDNDGVPHDVNTLLAGSRANLDAIEACTQRIEALAKQRAELKSQAWGR